MIQLTGEPVWLTELHSLLLAADRLEEFLQRLAGLAAQAMPADCSCGITLQPDRRPLTVASSDDFAVAVDEIQYTTGQGPCLEAMASGQTRRVPDLAQDQRWPLFGPQALASGVTGILSEPLTDPTGQPVGALNLYFTRPQAITLDTERSAEVFAGHASGAVAIARRLADRLQLSDDLRGALASRAVIDQAIGVIMAENRCGSEEAFSILRSASQHRNVKLRDVAAGIVHAITGQPAESGPFRPRHQHTPGRV